MTTKDDAGGPTERELDDLCLDGRPDYIKELQVENAALHKEIEAVKAGNGGGYSKCGHNAYWTGIYGTCMCCRYEASDAKAAEYWEQMDLMRGRLEKAESKVRELEAVTACHFGGVCKEWRERAEAAEKVVEAARREIEKEHAGWDAAHTPPGKPCELCCALKAYDASRAGKEGA